MQNSSTSLDHFNLSDSKLLVYPNPTLDNDIIIESPFPILNITLIDETGRLLYENRKIDTNFFKLTTSSFPPGVYYLKTTTSETIRTQQVMILR
ncbi:MAG: T9SS type A sorting domain-containing protein [Bacteroidetes bacterium]|nr:T9SS type A sorting domain-containing protein [Bacteroidota bacterium]MBL0073365.1 T9SS type A sorting domain-containing protein [Bacteroidota bacterium]